MSNRVESTECLRANTVVYTQENPITLPMVGKLNVKTQCSLFAYIGFVNITLHTKAYLYFLLTFKIDGLSFIHLVLICIVAYSVPICNSMRVSLL